MVTCLSNTCNISWYYSLKVISFHCTSKNVPRAPIQKNDKGQKVSLSLSLSLSLSFSHSLSLRRSHGAGTGLPISPACAGCSGPHYQRMEPQPRWPQCLQSLGEVRERHSSVLNSVLPSVYPLRDSHSVVIPLWHARRMFWSKEDFNFMEKWFMSVWLFEF